MRTVLIVVVMSACFAEEFQGQSEPDSTLGRNQIFIEFLGSGVLYSINYERRLGETVALRAGYTRWTELCLMECSGLDVVTAVPVIVSALHSWGGWGVMPTLYPVEMAYGVRYRLVPIPGVSIGMVF